MAIIDSDAHVVESDCTWEYLAKSEKHYRPKRVAEVGPSGETQEYWIIDDRVFPGRRPGLSGVDVGPHGDKVNTPDQSKYMVDVNSRIRHMDELGTDVQVLYPTMFIQPITTRPDVELALYRSYNRWLADVWSQGGGRLRWAAILPLLSMDESLDELRTAKEHGACAIMMRGVETNNRLLIDPYFFPMYEAASELDMPICVHTGNGSTDIMSVFPGQFGFPRFKLIGVGAFNVVVESELPDRFPNLRWGFIELSSQWLPYLIHDLARRFERRDKPMKDNVLRDNRIWVACQTNDDLPYVMSYVGDENLVIGTDYGHADTSTEIYALQTFKNQSEVSPESARKILDDNARALYGL